MFAWLKARGRAREEGFPTLTMTPDTVWRSVVSLRQPVLLIRCAPLEVLQASEKALDLLGVHSLQAVRDILVDALDAPMLTRLDMALAGAALFEHLPVRFRGTHVDRAVRLTVSALPDYPGPSTGFLFLVPEHPDELPMWPGLARELMMRLPYPVWLTDSRGLVTQANSAFQEFPVPLNSDRPLEARTPEDVVLLREGRDILLNLPGKVRASPTLSDVTLTLNAMGTWRVLHFALNPSDAHGLVCAIAMRIGVVPLPVVEPDLSELSTLMPPEVLEKVVQVRERERQDLGREIHDSLGQELTVLRLEMRRLSNLVQGSGLANETVMEHIRSVKSQTDKLALSARRIAYELRQESITANGLVGAIQDLVLDLRQRVGIATQFELSPGWLEPEDGMANHLRRSLQEMLNNVSKHAKASRCMVRLGLTDQRFWLEVHDDGVGMRAEGKSASIGLNSLRERAEIYAGTVTIRSRPDIDGTLVRIEFVERRWPPGARASGTQGA